jgi:hypothetical protein
MSQPLENLVEPFDHERRFVLTEAEADDFRAQIASVTAPVVYDPQRPVAFTRTTYLDTEDLAYYRASEGPVVRRLRIREYASALALGDPPILSGACFLEYKESMGPVRTKARLAVPPWLIARILADQGELPGRWRAEGRGASVLRRARHELHGCQWAPRLTTFYRRSSFMGEAGRVRVTIDEGIVFCRPCAIGHVGEVAPPGDVIAGFGDRLLEIKHHGVAPTWILKATERLVEAPSLSKFRMGMAALVGAGML